MITTVTQNRPKCSKCGEKDRRPGIRFCAGCASEVQKGMRQGYLTRLPPVRRTYRSSDARENVYETRCGSSHG